MLTIKLPATIPLQIDLAVSSQIHLRMCRSSALRWKWVALHMLSTCWLMKDSVSLIVNSYTLYAVWILNGDGSNVNCSSWPFNRCRKPVPMMIASILSGFNDSLLRSNQWRIYCMDAVCQRRQSLVVFKRDVQLCIIGVFPIWAAMFAISGCRSLLQSFEDTFLELVTVENPNITVGILTLSIAVPEI